MAASAGRREAGGFSGRRAEVVGVAELAAYAVEAVAHDEGGTCAVGMAREFQALAPERRTAAWRVSRWR